MEQKLTENRQELHETLFKAKQLEDALADLKHKEYWLKGWIDALTWALQQKGDNGETAEPTDSGD